MRNALTLLLVLALSAVVSNGARAQVELGFHLVIHAENPTPALSRGTVAGMFLKQVKHWDGGMRVAPVDQVDSRARRSFSTVVMGRSVTTVRSFWQRLIFSGREVPPPELDGDLAVMDFVRANPGAIGYISSRTRLRSGVRAVEITGPLRATNRNAGRKDDRHEEPEPVAPVLLVDARTPDLLHLSSPERGLLRSIDGGETWFRIRDGALSREITDLAVDPTDPRIIYVGTRLGLYRSTDGGRRFDFIDEVYQDVIQVAIDPRNPATVYVLARHPTQRMISSLWQSRDRGESFVSLSNALARAGGHRTLISALAFDAAGNGLYVIAGGAVLWSKDGRTWYRHGRIGYQVSHLTTDVSDPRRLYAATPSGVVLSADSGATWQRVGPSQPVHRVVPAPPALIALGEQAIYRSLDDGDTWEEVAAAAGRAIARDPRHPNRLIIACAGRFGFSTDRGATWTFGALPSPITPQVGTSGPAVAPPPPPPVSPLHLVLALESSDDHVAAIAVDPRNLQKVYAASQHGVWKSPDAGDTWSFAGGGLELTDVHALAIDPLHAGVLYAGTHGAGVWKSIDDGDSWQPARRGLTSLVIHSLAIDPHDPAMLYAGTRAGLFLSHDAGESWQSITELGPEGRIDREPGKRWMPPAQVLTFEPRHGLELTAATSRGSFYQGSVMTLLAERLDGTIGFPRSKARVGCRASGHPADDLPKPNECFGHFGINPRGLAIRDLILPEADSSSSFAATMFGLWRRPPKVERWTRPRLDANVAAIAVHPRSHEILYAGTSRGLRRSTDGGRHFYSTRVNEAVYSLAIDATGMTIYAGLGGGRLAILRDLGLSDGSRLKSMVCLPKRFQAGPRSEDRTTVEPAETDLATAASEETSRVIPAVADLWRQLQATPSTRYRLRAKLAKQLLEQEPRQQLGAPVPAGDRFDQARDILAESLRELQTLDGSIRRVGFSPDGRWLSTFHLIDDGDTVHSELRLLELAPLSPSVTSLRPEHVHWRALHDVALEPAHLRPVWVLPDPGPLLAWSANGRHLATHAGQGEIQVWSPGSPPAPEVTPTEPAAPRVPPARAFELELPAGASVGGLRDDGRAMAIIGADGALSWVAGGRDGVSSTLLPNPPADATEDPGKTAQRRPLLVLPRDTRWLLGFDHLGRVWAWSLEPGKAASADPADPAMPVLLHHAGAAFVEVMASEDGRWLAGRTDRQVLLWRLTSAGLAKAPDVLAESASRTPFGFLFSPDHRWLAVHGAGELRLWDIAGDELGADVVRLEHHGELPTFSPDGQLFVVRDLDTARTWDLSQEQLPVNVEGLQLARRWEMLSRPLVDWQRWPTEAGARGAHSRNRRWFTLIRGIDVFLWDVAEPIPEGMLGRAGRFGPMGLHADEPPLMPAVGELVD